MKKLLLLALFLCSARANAQVRIVPESRGAAQLSQQSTRFQVQINPGARLARVSSTWIFNNSAPADFEASFIAQAPTSAIMSQFSYWFRGQKTLARIVESQRAAQIYRDATTPPRPRDPALVEMLARNFFKVRIAPVEAKKPLQIELVWLQPVEKSGENLQISLPWREANEKISVEKWSVAAQFSSPVENLSAIGAGEKTANPQSFEGAGELPTNATLRFQAPKIASAVLTSRSGGDGYFVGVFSENQWKNRANWNWRPTSLHNHILNAGERLVAGRFKKWPSKADFQAQNSLDAQTWWAAFELDFLGENPKNRARGIALSKRFGLPSKWTNWLAIPDAERARLKPIIEREKRAQASANLNVLGRAMAQEIAAGRAKSNAFRKMKVQFDANCRVVEAKPSNCLANVINEQLAYISGQIRYANYGNDGKKSPQKSVTYAKNLLLRVRRLRPFASENGRRWSQNAEVSLAKLQLEFIAPDWAKSRVNGRENLKSRAQIARILRGVEPFADEFSNEFSGEILGPFAANWAQLKLAPTLNPKKVAAARANIENAATLFPVSVKNRRELIESALKSAEESQIYQPSTTLKEALAQEVVAKRENGEKARQLRADLAALEARLSFKNPYYTSPTQLPVDKYLQKIAVDWQRAELAETPDAAQINALKSEFDRLKSFAAPYTIEQSLRSGRWDALLKLRREIAQKWVAATQNQSDSPRAAELKTLLQKILDTQTEKIHENAQGYRFKADDDLREAEREALEKSSAPLREALVKELGSSNAGPNRIAGLRAQLDALQARTIYNKTQISTWLRWGQGRALENVLNLLRAARAEDAPDAKFVADLERRALELQPFDLYTQNWEGWRGARNDANATQFGQMRVERIKIRADREKAQKRLAKAPDDAKLNLDVAQLRQLENQLRVRMGDPLIAVKAPQNARQVLAIFPSGELMPLKFNAQTAQWEARFDVPTHAREGDYAVKIIVVFGNGTRQNLTMHFNVDLQAPQGVAAWKMDGQNLVLTLQSDDLTDRASAFLPSGERIELRRNTDGIFQNCVALPANFNLQNGAVRFILTDKAHNRTEISVSP